ncbi:MAG: DUF4932 domain-containing protein [Kofleriaceae bacterium]
MSRIAVVLLFSLACRSNNREPVDDPPQKSDRPATPIALPHGMTIETDPRFELISIVMRLSGAPEYLGSKTPYAREVDTQFAAFADHPAIQKTRALRRSNGIGYDAPMLLAAQLDASFALRTGGAIELAQIDKRWAGVDVAGYVELLREFRDASKFTAFYDGQSGYRALVQQALAKVVDAAKPVPWFEAMFGPGKARFQVVPGLLNGTRNFGVRATAPDGTSERYQVLGISRPDGMPATDDDTVALLVHEMAHSYINPLFGEHRGELERAGTQIYALVEQRMQKQNYGDWATTLNEAGVRAITVLFMLERRGSEIGARAARSELRSGFVWTNELVDALRKRDRTKPLAAAMPKIVAFFDALAAQYAKTGLPAVPFLGPVDAVFVDPTFVAPPGSGPLATYAQRIHDQLFPKMPLAVTSDHVLGELPGRNLVTYGSPATNPLVVNMLAHAQIQVAKDLVVVGTKRFTGPGLVLVFARFRHDDPAHGVAVYAAAADADLVGVNGLSHGQHDWLVGRKTGAGYELLETGDFPRAADGAWMLP